MGQVLRLTLNFDIRFYAHKKLPQKIYALIAYCKLLKNVIIIVIPIFIIVLFF